MSKLTQSLNKPASIGADFLFAVVMACGAAFLAAFLPLNWIPIIGPQAPGIAAGVIGVGYYVRARKNSPVNWNNTAARR